MNKFYTCTASDSEHCNDRSKRFNTLAEAHDAAMKRLTITPSLHGVVIMEAIEEVTRRPIETPFIIKQIH